MYEASEQITRHKGPVRAKNQQRSGLAAGSIILTLDGEIPVEWLQDGDRIITRSGARKLRGVRSRVLAGTPMRIRKAAHGPRACGDDLLVAPGQHVLVRNRRAEALPRKVRRIACAERLSDGATVAPDPGASGLRVYDLYFDEEQVFYANGIEAVSAVA